MLIDADTVFDMADFEGCHCILVDEAQFLAPAIIEALRSITVEMKVPVICYGLRNDFRTSLFPGSRRLLELADTIEEVKTTCHFCNSKATLNLKSVDGQPTLAGPAVCLGAEELYLPVCFKHYQSKIEEGSGSPLDFAQVAIEEAKYAAKQEEELEGPDSPRGATVVLEAATPERAERRDREGTAKEIPSPEDATRIHLMQQA